MGFFMKKSIIFYLFLLTICTFFIAVPKVANAEMDASAIIITAKISTAYGEDYIDGGEFNAETSTFSADMEVFGKSGCILLSASVKDFGNYTYQWKDASGRVVSNASDLNINKQISTANINKSPIMVGDSTYTITIINSETGESSLKNVLIRITDRNMITSIQSHAIGNFDNPLTISSDPITFFAKLPIINGIETTWYIKTPNSTSYRPICNEEKFIFEPSQILSSENGYGDYKLFAVALNTATSQKHYSQTYTVKTVAPKISQNVAGYSITSKVVDNSRANIEGFKYTLNTTANLDAKNIYWYVSVNDVMVKTSTGDVFVYEPTTTTSFKVEAKYKTAEGLITLASHKESPQVTGTHILIISVLVGVAILSVILTISIKVTNKKRDVVW